MPERAELTTARRHLSQAEAGYRTQEGLFHLEEGLALLDDLIGEAGAGEQLIARNLAASYAARLCTAIEALLERDRALPEPALEHLFRVLIAFDHGEFAMPPGARALKITIARRLIDRYYEGHPAAVKEKALAELTKITLAGQAGGRRAGRAASRSGGERK